tara:strand:- start:162 stop:392 length:231 start_codon:yes stop_codon:yes gene_type:complete
MRVNTLILTLLFSLVLLFSFFIFKLNNQVVSIDLLFIEKEISLGKIILSSVLVGFFITVFFELLYSFLKRKKEVNK